MHCFGCGGTGKSIIPSSDIHMQHLRIPCHVCNSTGKLNPDYVPRKGELIALDVKRSEVMHSNHKSVVEIYKIFDRHPKEYRQHTSLSFSGYDNDYREIYEIPEIRKWMQKFVRLVPHFMYYIDPKLDLLQPLIACIGDIIDVRYKGPRMDLYELQDYIKRGGKATNFHINFSINSELILIIRKGLKNFGEKTGDVWGAHETIKYFDNFFNMIRSS